VKSAVAIALLALAVAGCGSSAGSKTTTTASAASRRTQIAACLKKQGVTLPSRPAGAPRPNAGGGGGFLFGGGNGPPGGGQRFRANPKFQAAAKKCGLSFQTRGRFNPSSNPQFRQSIDRFVACVRRHGYDMPAANFSGNGPVFDASKVNRNDPKFQKAAQACQSLLNVRRGPTGPTGQVQQQ